MRFGGRRALFSFSVYFPRFPVPATVITLTVQSKNTSPRSFCGFSISVIRESLQPRSGPNLGATTVPGPPTGNCPPPCLALTRRVCCLSQGHRPALCHQTHLSRRPPRWTVRCRAEGSGPPPRVCRSSHSPAARGNLVTPRFALMLDKHEMFKMSNRIIFAYVTVPCGFLFTFICLMDQKLSVDSNILNCPFSMLS